MHGVARKYYRPCARRINHVPNARHDTLLDAACKAVAGKALQPASADEVRATGADGIVELDQFKNSSPDCGWHGQTSRRIARLTLGDRQPLNIRMSPSKPLHGAHLEYFTNHHRTDRFTLKVSQHTRATRIRPTSTT
jgi:hypothetical protein